jgi:hypothetical protein
VLLELKGKECGIAYMCYLGVGKAIGHACGTAANASGAREAWAHADVGGVGAGWTELTARGRGLGAWAAHAHAQQGIPWTRGWRAAGGLRGEGTGAGCGGLRVGLGVLRALEAHAREGAIRVGWTGGAGQEGFGEEVACRAR